MNKIVKYIVLDIARNKIVIAYTLFLAVISFSVFSLEDDPGKGLLTLMNLVIFIVPLVSIIFSAIYMYNSSEFIELLVSQPLRRKKIWMSFFYGLSASLCSGFVVGVAIPVLIFSPDGLGLSIIVTGLFQTPIFISIALVAYVRSRDKAKGIGIAILLWLYFSILFDGVVLFLLFQFADYPIEKAMIGISLLNPIDLSRILVLLRMDVSALMGYTGAVFQDFFGTRLGMLISAITMIAWIVFPLLYSTHRFTRKDL
jgi:Cu-processing system permease protein